MKKQIKVPEKIQLSNEEIATYQMQSSKNSVSGNQDAHRNG